MTLVAGQSLAHYEVLGPLGKGGMGEVWRARDTRLDREVAIKVLPEEFVSDDERLRRFEREAKVLASLNHPNVAAIHGIDQIDDVCFLVLELAPGESLAERLARGPLPVEDALDVARQIAEGLEAAHEAGVVHRDLKPGNVHVGPDGVVKVLDFGLAKPARADSGDTSTTAARPDSFLVTAEGMVLGTPTYMSPEQARGKAVDRRTDVWAFGCVLFECLAGTRAFPGGTTSDTLARVIEREPEWAALPRATPPHVESLLRRCLVKDPRRRLRDIGEARLALEGSGADWDAVSAAVRPGRPAQSVQPWMVLFAVVSLALAATVALIWTWSQPATEEPAPVTRYEVVLPVDDLRRTGIRGLAVSPDGRTVACSIGSSEMPPGIHLREADELELRHLPGTDGAEELVFSRDGRWLFYHEDDLGELRRISVEGGSPAVVMPGNQTVGIDATPGGDIVHSRGWSEGLAVAGVRDGTHRELTRVRFDEGEGNHHDPCVLPDGRHVLFCIWTGGQWDDALVAIADMETGEHRVLFAGAIAPRLLPLRDGTHALLSVNRRTLWARRFDLEALEVTGESVALVEGIQVVSPTGRAHYEVSPAGTLVYSPGSDVPWPRRLVLVDGEGNEEPVVEVLDHYDRVHLARDGSRLVFDLAGAVYEVHVIDLTVPASERVSRRLTFDADAYSSLISPDGDWIAYISNPDGAYDLFAQEVDGGEPILIAEGDHRTSSWSPDGRWVLADKRNEERVRDLWVIPVPGTEGDPYRLVASAANEKNGIFSPDGKWVVYLSDETGTNELFAVSFPEGTNRTQLTRNGPVGPVGWSHGGGAFTYSKKGALYSLPIQAGTRLAVGRPEIAVEGRWWDVSAPGADGRFPAAAIVPPTQDRPRFVVVENFGTEVLSKLGGSVPPGGGE